MDQEKRRPDSKGARMRGQPLPDDVRLADGPAGWGFWKKTRDAAIVRPKPKVMIVAEPAATRLDHRNTLAVFEADILDTASGAEALRAARAHDFALILVGAGMPDMDGFELTRLLRAEARARAVPIILFVPGDDPAAVRQAYRMGAVECLADNPVDTEMLRQKARAYFDIDARRAELQATVERMAAEVQRLELAGKELGEQRDLLRRQSTYDSLTQLPGKLLFEDRLDGAIKRAVRNKQPFALALMDINGFKLVNDQFGRTAGDELLTSIGRRLLRMVRASDTVARLGGDEFAIVLEDLKSAVAVDYLGQKMAAHMAMPCSLLDAEGRAIDVAPKVSIGIAVYQPGQTAEALIAAANVAMYEAKRAGGGVRVFEGAADTAASRQAGGTR
jgi:diguanylate cyclase (GGDEF)-like protein